MRITDIMKNNQLVRNTGRHQYELDKMNHQLSTGQKIRKPSDNPGAATNQMFFRTRVNELNQFETNLDAGKGRLNFMDGELERVTEILQRIRVLTVQASNGIYQGDDAFALKKVISEEIDQHLRALIEISNGRDSTGRFLFGGHQTEINPFQAVEASLPELKGIDIKNFIVSVNYQGDIGKHLTEVERSQYIDTNLPGNRVFWSTNVTLTGAVDTSGYTAPSDQNFKIDGQEIRVSAGDTVNDIIEKINNAHIGVTASRIGQDFFSLQTVNPHQIWLEDVDGGTVLQDLGLLSSENPEIGNNYAESARLAGSSLFDTIIKLRNDLLSGDILEIGGRDLGNIDEAMKNIMRFRAEVGAKQNRVEEHEKRVAWDKTFMTELLAKSEGIDFPETIMNLKWLETVHNYALNVGSRIIRPSL
ncbi:MAG: flagellar hook-associated protein 3, partial [Spirochaetia bacterium]|nr:flagellar hook-associated protein 3 [Spirochaetia bacterium]